MKTRDAAPGSWHKSLRPARMERIALVARPEDFDAVLRCVGARGCVELESDVAEPGARATQGADTVESLTRVAARRNGTAALVGWCPMEDVPQLTEQLGRVGGALVRLPRPKGIDPPTLLCETNRAHRLFSPLVRGYTTVPYADLDPTLLAGIAYILMFGIMFGDVGHGLLLMACALLLRSGRIRPLESVRHLWPFVFGAGAAGCAAGLLYGEFFGPTGVVPTLWLRPLDQPLRLLVYAVALGILLLAVSYGIGIVNRWREAGPRSAFYAVSGIAGAALFLGLVVLALGVWRRSGATEVTGAALTVMGILAAGFGLAAVAPSGPAGGFQVGLGLFDAVTRIGSNVLSFARLAAFGLTHAALGAVIWEGTAGAARHGVVGTAGAALLFVVGNCAAFALEGLVVGVQAMRLEYYEMFSRIFESEGRPFRPFRLSPTSPEAIS